MEDNKIKILNKVDLLKSLIRDEKKKSSLYKAGIYWRKKSKFILKEILNKGINNFRGNDNNIGQSFSDNQNINILNDYFGGLRSIIKFIFEKIFPFKNVFVRQVHLTSSYQKELNLYKSKYYEKDEHSINLVNLYRFNNTISCGCKDISLIKNKIISNHYLIIADTHYNFSKFVDFRKYKSFFEIGGGFGANIHFIIENYSNLKKFIYLDLPANLYIATQYLKMFYNESVKDYLDIKSNKIVFEDNEKLEIFCIPPWKIEDIDTSIDLFQNSNSFVEMPVSIIKNYAFYIDKILSSNSKIILSNSEKFNSKTKIDPNLIKKFFKAEFNLIVAPSMRPGPGRFNNFYISK